MSKTNVQALQLYRQLLRYGNQLQHTDQTFFKNRIRAEFRKNQSLEASEEIAFELKRGQALLDNAAVI